MNMRSAVSIHLANLQRVKTIYLRTKKEQNVRKEAIYRCDF